MKLVKQPLFIAGIGTIVLAIVVAIVGTVVNPSSAVINKFEQAISKSDSEMLKECFSPTLSMEEQQYAATFSSLESLIATFGVTGDIEYQLLVGDAEKVELEDDKDVKNIPGVMVIKVNDKVVYITENDMKVIIIDGKEYIYTGLE